MLRSFNLPENDCKEYFNKNYLKSSIECSSTVDDSSLTTKKSSFEYFRIKKTYLCYILSFVSNRQAYIVFYKLRIVKCNKSLKH